MQVNVRGHNGISGTFTLADFMGSSSFEGAIKYKMTEPNGAGALWGYISIRTLLGVSDKNST